MKANIKSKFFIQPKFISLCLLFFFFSFNFISAESWGYNYLEKEPIKNITYNYNITNTNSSEYWDDMNTINATQMEDNSGVLNILESWINSLITATDNWNVSGTNLFPKDLDYNVGIGTTSPYSGLHYQGDIFYLTPNAGADSNDNITIKNYATGNGAPNIILKTADISGAYGIGVGTLSLIGGSKTTHYGGIGGGGGKISLQGGRGRDAGNDPSSYAPILLQSNGGNVGIGTDSPDRTFEIFGATSVFRFRDSGSTASATNAFIEFGGTDEGNWNRTGYIGDGSSGNTDLYFQAEKGDLRLGDSSSHSVLILSEGDATFSGKVGIGTSSPESKLAVDVYEGNTPIETTILDLRDTGGWESTQDNRIYSIKMGRDYDSPNREVEFGYINLANDYGTSAGFFVRNLGVTNFVINSTGNVGINTLAGGDGSSYVCVDASGVLFSQEGAC